MPTIEANTGIVTQINVFTVPEGGQQALIDFLAEAAKLASRMPGWISASVHRSRDGTRVVNYAQSESLETAQRIIDRLREGGWLDRNKLLGEAHPGLYDVVFMLENQRRKIDRFDPSRQGRTGFDPHIRSASRGTITTLRSLRRQVEARGIHLLALPATAHRSSCPRSLSRPFHKSATTLCKTKATTINVSAAGPSRAVSRL